MKVYREETPRKGKTPGGVESQVRLQRTKFQALTILQRSQAVTKILFAVTRRNLSARTNRSRLQYGGSQAEV